MIPTIVTPLKSSNEIDYEGLERLIEKLIEGNKAIADFQDNAIPSLRNGLKVYRWGVVKSK